MTAAVSSDDVIGGQDSSPCAVQPSATAAPIGGMRTGMLEVLLAKMNAAQIPYCLLNGFQGYPEVIASDVDFMVHPKDASRIAPLLLEVAKRCDALLVQAIQHETGAWYFILAKPAGGAVAYLHPDCTTDYRRDGRLWLKAEPVLKKRQPYKTFFVPATADEFLYYLIKKTLKQQITSVQLQRIATLYLNCPEECHERIRRFCSEQTTEALVRVFVRREIGWMRFYLPALLSELRASVPMESRWKRTQQWLREGRRRVERAVYPTGLGVAVCGGTEPQRANLATALEKTLRPAFRRTVICAEATTGDSLWGAVAFWLAKVRSTLVIRRKESPETGTLERDEIRFVFAEAGASEAIGKPFGGGDSHHPLVLLDGSRPLKQNLECAAAATLEYLAARLRRRMKAPSSTANDMPFGERQEAASNTGSVQ